MGAAIAMSSAAVSSKGVKSTEGEAIESAAASTTTTGTMTRYLEVPRHTAYGSSLARTLAFGMSSPYLRYSMNEHARGTPATRIAEWSIPLPISRFSHVSKRAISRPFAIAIRAARLYTAWLRYRSVGRRIPTIQECLLSSARSFARSKQDEVALLRRQGSFRLTSSCSTRP
ncbi:hypothetical protein QYF36_021880 [Acer negundo]|nr:hypothetical protein QYF36_021880 [Acer negundo]